MTKESFIDNNPVAEQRWLTQCTKAFEVAKTIDISPCVCQVPKTIKEPKIQAYVPQKIGFGPYHYFRPDLFVTERHKLTIASTNYKNLKQVQGFIRELKLVEPLIRAQYDKFLDIDTETLCWILTIDSLYLLHFLDSYDQKGQPDAQSISDSLSSYEEIDNYEHLRILAQDILMLENQIPCAVLDSIERVLSGPNDYAELFYNFCKAHSPLQIAKRRNFRGFRGHHLLAYMHHLIVNNRFDPDTFDPDMIVGAASNLVAYTSNSVCVNMVQTATAFGIPGADAIEPAFTLLSELPWDKITRIVKKEEDEKKPLIEEIEIPSVTELEEILKVKFKVIERGGIRDIDLVPEGDEHTIYLPGIILNSDSEVILRNLVAYEAATPGLESSLELAQYVDFMCGIVDTRKDVEILKKANIIKGNSTLNDEEIADLFNGIPKTTGKFKKKKKSDLEKVIETVNEKYDNKLRVKVYGFIKKHICTSYWRSLSLLSTILLILLLSLQAVCEVYGCSK